MAILIIKDLAIPNFNEIGDAFLLEVDPQYTRALYGRILAAKLLNQLTSDEIKVICDGFGNAIKKNISQLRKKLFKCWIQDLSFLLLWRPAPWLVCLIIDM